MGMKLTGTGDFKPTPVANVREAGKYFVGTLLSLRREVKVRGGKRAVYEFAVKDTDMSLQVRNDAGEYVEASVKAGDKVSVFAPLVLDGALQKAFVGMDIKILSKGLVKGKNAEFFNFDVEAL